MYVCTGATTSIITCLLYRANTCRLNTTIAVVYQATQSALGTLCAALRVLFRRSGTLGCPHFEYHAEVDGHPASLAITTESNLVLPLWCLVLFGVGLATLAVCSKPTIDRLYPLPRLLCHTAGMPLHPVRCIFHVWLSGDVRGQLNPVYPDEGTKD